MTEKKLLRFLTEVQSLDLDQALNHRVRLETLRQARKSFNLAQQSFQLALVMTLASAIVSLIGAGLLVSGKASEGSITTAAGLVSSAGFLQLTRDASDRLQQANERLDRLTPPD